MAEKEYTPMGGWLEVDINLTWEERVTLFPLKSGQQYKFIDPKETNLLEVPVDGVIPQQVEQICDLNQ